MTTCILTDSTAQFPTPIFEGREAINMMDLHLEVDDKRYERGEGLKTIDLPKSAIDGPTMKVEAPSADEFEARFKQLGQIYDSTVAVLHAGSLTKTAAHAEEAAKRLQGQVDVTVIDCGTTALGMGLLIQEASAAALAGEDAGEIELLVRSLMPQVYSVFAIPNLSYLQHAGYLNYSQAMLGEFLKVLPVYVLDQGELTPTQKARNLRQVVDILHEFLWEFPNLEHIGILQGSPPFETETRALRERIAEDFPHTPISEHIINPALATLIGPHSLGLFVKQKREIF
jgi:DegV family protein with EDD domain